MKFVALALLAAVASAGVLATQSAWERHHAALVSGVHQHSDDDPPPVDCPMCGGNAELHFKTLRKMFTWQSQLVLGASIAR